MERFPQLLPADMTPAQKAVADEIASGPRGGVRGPFLVLLHNPELARRLQQLGEYLRFKTRLSDALTELSILVTARHWNCQFEWYAHEKLARKAGLEAKVIDAIAGGRQPEALSDDQASVYSFCREVHQYGEPSAHSFASTRDRFGLDGTLDLLSLCGYYSLLAMILNAAQTSLPDGAQSPLRPTEGSLSGCAPDA